MASSSSSSSPDQLPPKIEYDVFISFRGEDSRKNIVSYLLEALLRKKIQVYIDYKLEVGDEISQVLLKAIEKSKLSVVIFSERYAYSKWCLDELVKITECKKKLEIIPVFYHVDPSHVRNQTGIYADAFAKYNQDSKLTQRVQKWKDALTKAANQAGRHSINFSTEAKLTDTIVDDVLKKLDHERSNNNDLEGFVGISEHITHIESSLCLGSANVRFVGIWGMGGIGKTTIAEAVYKKHCSEYEGCCFLAHMRDESKNGRQHYLRDKLLSELLEEDIHISTPSVGSTFVGTRLQRKKVLIVLDDVESVEQLEYLVERYDCFGPESRVILTTRDKHVLSKAVDKGIGETYEVKELNSLEALHLFSLNAFQQSQPSVNYLELSDRVVNYGVPLALKVLGSFLHSKGKEEWKSELEKLKRIPNVKIHDVLRLSYDGLDRGDQYIFLDIACFFKGENKDRVKSLLDGYGFSSSIGISTLIDKSLITISSDYRVWMHDLIQEMGWEIVRQESYKMPGERSRLWDLEEVHHVLKNSVGTKAVECMSLDISKVQEIHLSPQAFTTMCNLRFLKFYSTDLRSNLYLPKGLQFLPNELRYLHWDAYPSKSLPSHFCPENLVELKMQHGLFEKLWNGVKNLVNLRNIDLCYSKHVTELPDFSEALILENLLHVPSSIEYLQNLRILNMGDCRRLRRLPSNIYLRSLRKLILSGCSSLEELSWNLENIEELNLKGAGIKQLPSTASLIQFFDKLTVLYLTNCKMLQCFPSNIHLISLKKTHSQRMLKS
ncbi:Disease resistance protein (TIR-NBS-LRR class) [Quillaja saponaria]|uniref:Disease resistance protein (TIR-NBS-LRR class) n=1 Tax=Quillaja saponaria TaxID=32244 RepID=A0AAD7L6J0_QUISA|nr:Disease resistance protein (TIR-NBS-LRR class) [Quillaja saponaria]